jgi:Tfp pilus assembly protein PilF
MAPPPKTVKVTRAKSTPAKPAASPHRERIKQGVQLQQAGKLDQATAIYQEVLRQDANNADAWHFLGVAALERRMPENGRELIERSLQLKPDNAIYHHNMAAALAELGDLENAETHYREAVRLKPDYAEAYYNLTGSIKVRAGDPAIEKVAALLQNTGVSPQDRCFLHFAAGKIYDDIGAYDRAFAHYEAGNLAKDVRFRPEEYWRQVAALRVLAAGRRLDRDLRRRFPGNPFRPGQQQRGAGLHRRHASIRDLLGRADPGQPPGSVRGRRAAGSAGDHRGAAQTRRRPTLPGVRPRPRARGDPRLRQRLPRPPEQVGAESATRRRQASA